MYGLAVNFGREGTTVGASWTVGSAFSTSAEWEARSAGVAARAGAVTAGWTNACLWAVPEGEQHSDSTVLGRVMAAESWRVPPSGTGSADNRARAQTVAAAVGSETVGDGKSAVLAGSAAGRLPGSVLLTMFTGAGDDGRSASS